MRILRTIAVSFSLYSRIPMPSFKWDEKDYRHNLIFFPLVGVVMAAVSMAVYAGLDMISADRLLRIFVFILLPLLITGGFHVDGYMDTEDALSSYGPKEKKLEILKDPHVGAFAVIGLVKCGLIYAAALSIICTDKKLMFASFTSFVMSRALSALLSMCLKKTKKEGMLYDETKGKGGIDVTASIAWIVLAIVTAAFIDIKCAMFMCLSYMISVVYYIYKTKKEFDGVTGDTAGYFVTVSETFFCVILAVMKYF